MVRVPSMSKMTALICSRGRPCSLVEEGEEEGEGEGGRSVDRRCPPTSLFCTLVQPVNTCVSVSVCKYGNSFLTG